MPSGEVLAAERDLVPAITGHRDGADREIGIAVGRVVDLLLRRDRAGAAAGRRSRHRRSRPRSLARRRSPGPRAARRSSREARPSVFSSTATTSLPRSMMGLIAGSAASASVPGSGANARVARRGSPHAGAGDGAVVVVVVEAGVSSAPNARSSGSVEPVPHPATPIAAPSTAMPAARARAITGTPRCAARARAAPADRRARRTGGSRPRARRSRSERPARPTPAAPASGRCRAAARCWSLSTAASSCPGPAGPNVAAWRRVARPDRERDGLGVVTAIVLVPDLRVELAQGGELRRRAPGCANRRRCDRRSLPRTRAGRTSRPFLRAGP